MVFHCLLFQFCLHAFKLDPERLFGKLLSINMKVKQHLDPNISKYTYSMSPETLVLHNLGTQKIKAIVVIWDFSHRVRFTNPTLHTSHRVSLPFFQLLLKILNTESLSRILSEEETLS